MHNNSQRIYAPYAKYKSIILAMAVSMASTSFGGECLKFDSSSTPASRLKEQIEARKTRLTINRCAKAPVVDGVLDDPAWKNAGNINLPGTPPTTVKICFDDAAIYIGVVCQKTPGYKAPAADYQRDGNIWSDDCLELFFLPPLADLSIYQFVINAANAIYDRCGQVTSYDPEWSHAVKRSESGWTAELAIPYKALELPGPVRSIGFNMHRAGPNLPVRSLAQPDRDPGAGCLILAGVTAEGEQLAKSRDDQSQMLSMAGRSLSVQLERFEAEPGERWIPIELTLRPKGPLAQAKVEARLFAIGKNEPLEVASVKPATNMVVLKVDLLPKGLAQGRLEVALLEGDVSTGAASMILSRKPCSRPLKPGEKIPVVLDVIKGLEPDGAWPVTFGLPFPAGALWETKNSPLPIRLVDGNGAEIPFQFEVTARWAPEGSVKWLRADALVSPSRGCFMESAASAAKTTKGLRILQEGDAITIETGVAKHILGKGISPIREIRRGDQRVAWSAGTRGLYLVDQKGQIARASANEESMVIESPFGSAVSALPTAGQGKSGSGLVSACVRFEGWYTTENGDKLARHITRVEAFAGQAFLRVTHTLVLTEDTNKTWFKELGWEFAVEPGAAPEALFGLAPPAIDFQKTTVVPLRGGVKSAYMLQDSHYRFTLGTNHYKVATVEANGGESCLAEGEECGDWAALQGKANGFLVGCRDTARQHPKEFEIFENRVVLKLFSNRAGEELDYRTTTLMKRWNLPEWIKMHNQKGKGRSKHDEKKFIAKLEAYVNNAAGGARTHDILFAATAPGTPSESLARLGGLHGAPVLALADPFWSYQTRVMGPNYPRDMKRFPDFEKGVDSLFQYYLDIDSAWGEHGFIDYFAGPHGNYYMDNKVPVLFRYVEFSYYFRAQIWLLYARSGDRATRRYAEGSNRSYLDNRFVHWGDKTGYFRLNNTAVADDVPIYWHESYHLLTLGELVDNFMRHYYLTGDRRMKDGLIECAKAFKAGWSESKVTSDWTKHSIFQHCMQLYGFTGDEEMGAMGMRTLDLITDPQGGILLAKRAYNSSTYKDHQAIRSLVTAYLQYPTPKLLRVCERVAEFLQEFPYNPFGYTRPGSIVGPLLYDLTSNPAQAQSLAIAARSIGGLYDPKTGKIDADMIPKVCIPPNTTFVFDAGYILDAIVRTGLDKVPNIVSWTSYTDELGSARPILRKGEKDVLRLRYQATGRPKVIMLDSTVNKVNQRDIGLMTVTSIGPELTKGEILMPKDVPSGDYMVEFDARGPAALFASAIIPLVLYAPDYWIPLAATEKGEANMQRPPLRFFFNVPKDTVRGRIFFSGLAQLYDPAGNPWPKNEPKQGWVDLPADKSGLWSFASIRQGLVRVVNLPPFFAFDDPKAYFEPVMDWKSTMTSDEPPLQTNAPYLPGVGNIQGNLAANLSGRKYFRIDPPKEQGSAFFPNTEGTLEFYIRPNWNFFDLKEEEIKGLVSPVFFVDARQNSMHFTWNTNGKMGKIPFGGLRAGPSMILKDRWTHVAIVWGPTRQPEVIWGQYGAKPITSQQRQKKIELTIFVNGKKSTQQYINSPIPAEGQPFLPLSSLAIGGLREDNRIDAAIDNLRLSDIQRYRDDFSPPPPESEFRIDQHTRALFLFNGNTQGEGYNQTTPIIGTIKE